MEGGVKCIKYMLFVFNLLFVITGITLIAAAAVIQISYSKFLDFLGDGLTAPVIFIVAGCIIFVVSFFGCCGAVKESNCMMLTFAFMLTVIFLLEIGAGIAGYIFLNKLNSSVKPLMTEALDSYNMPDHDGVTQTWDYVQHEYRCCGIQGYADWQQSNWHKDKPKESVPDSCCRTYSSGCGTGMAVGSVNETIYENGCLPIFINHVKVNGSLFVGVAIGLSAIQLLGIVFSCLLARGIRGSYEAV